MDAVAVLVWEQLAQLLQCPLPEAHAGGWHVSAPSQSLAWDLLCTEEERNDILSLVCDGASCSLRGPTPRISHRGLSIWDSVETSIP